MSNMWIIVEKELRSYFDSASTYVFVVLFLILTGTYFVENVFLENVASLRLLFESAPVVMCLFVPAVTMRLISEEKMGGTYELLGTKPIRSGEIVLGKFVASWILVLCTLLPTFVYAVVLSMVGRLDWGTVVGGYLGLTLVSGSFVAIGLFTSTLSNNEIVSLTLGCIIISCLFFLDQVLPFLPTGLVSPVEFMSAGHHFSSMSHGVIDSRDLIYFVTLVTSFTLLAAIATAREYGQSILDWRGYVPPSQMMRVVLVGIILLLANLVSSGMFFRVDLTAGQVYTLSSLTKSLLSSLDDNLLVRVYLSPDLPPPYHNHRSDIQSLLEEYRAYSRGKLHYRFLNPMSAPDVEQDANEVGVTPLHVKTVKNDRVQTTKAYAGLALSYADRFESLPVVTSVERLEYDMTRVIRHLMGRNTPVVGLLTGQGEPGPESMKRFLDALSKHYVVTTYAFRDSDSVPANIMALLVLGPHRRFEDREKSILDRYVMRGGRVAFFLNTMISNPTRQEAHRLDLNLEDMFDTYGWVMNNDLVVDTRCADLAGSATETQIALSEGGLNPFFPVVVDFGKSKAAFADLPAVVLSYVSSLDLRLAEVRGIEATVIASSSARSARLTGDSIDINVAHLNNRVQFSEEHIPLAATFEGTFKSAFGGGQVMSSQISSGTVLASREKGLRTKIAVVGDADFVMDRFSYGYQNVSFALNMVDWLVDDTGLELIHTRGVAPPPLSEVEEVTKTTAKLLAFAGPPALVVSWGLVRLANKAKRRRKNA